MRFMLRCIFYLSFVYASILANAGGTTTGDLAATARAVVAAPAIAAASQAAAGLSAYCRRDTGKCLADSAKLTALVDASTDVDLAQSAAPPTARRLDPRHRARGAMQARMP